MSSERGLGRGIGMDIDISMGTSEGAGILQSSLSNIRRSTSRRRVGDTEGGADPGVMRPSRRSTVEGELVLVEAAVVWFASR
jgi:hypothetical protein